MARRRIGKYPSFRDWRQKNPVMIPDRGFTKQLKKLNKDYEVVWDWGSEKWEIWCFPKDQEPYHITTIQTKNKTYTSNKDRSFFHLYPPTLPSLLPDL